jgi:hypothetical protein
VLVEVLVGSVVILIVMMGVLLSMDVSAAMNREHRNRAVAADLAQQDQERMRALPVTTLSNHRLTRTVAVGGASYTVSSRADWVRDTSGAIGCTADTTRAEYLALTSSVSWSNMGNATPLVMHGLATPTAGVFGTGQGSAAVQVVDRAGAALPGVGVSLSGPAAASDTTDGSGCAVFGNITAGTYTLNATSTQPARVDVSGNSTLSMSAAVVASSTHLFTAPYDRPATANVSFDTKVGGVFVPATARAVTVTASGLPAPGTRVFVPPTIPAATTTLGSLYPFTGGYAVYGGDCATADPRTAPTSSAAYFASNPGQIVSAPGGTVDVTVHLPAINVVVRNSANAILQNARVRVTASGSGCGTFPFQSTTASGTLPSPGHPFGGYTLCADDNNRHRATATVANTSVDGTAVTTLRLSSSQTSNCS